MKVIRKYVIGHTGFGDNITPVNVPFGSQFLHVGQQGDNICAWYLVDPAVTGNRTDEWKQIGTGHEYEDSFYGQYMGTVVSELVWHMFVKFG